MGLALKEVVGELHVLSDRISTQARSIALGIVALVWALLTNGDDSKLGILVTERRVLIWLAFLSILALVFDYLQYVSGYWDTCRVLSKAEDRGEEEAVFNKRSLFRRLRNFFFYVKQVVVMLAACGMCVLLFRIVAR